MSNSESSQYLRPGTVVDGYEIQYELGRGAMAVVYLAKQLDLDRLVAFKVLSGTLAQDKDYVSRFFNEARAAAALSHPAIIQAYKAGITADGLYYFCMEYVEGESLLDIINENHQVPILQSLELMTEIASALDYGWQRYKFTHGDIKPENIMVNMQGQAKLADFGLAKVEGHDYSGNEVMLTPLYAAPELIRDGGNKRDCRTDIYAFGATLYHAIAGTPPFPGTDAQEVLDRHLHENPEPLNVRYPQTPQVVSNLVHRMLIKDPTKRMQTWEEVLEALRAASSSITSPKKKFVLNKPSEAQNRLPQKPQPPKQKINAIYWVVAAFLLVIFLFMAVVLRTSRTPKPAPQTELQLQESEPQPVAKPAEPGKKAEDVHALIKAQKEKFSQMKAEAEKERDEAPQEEAVQPQAENNLAEANPKAKGEQQEGQAEGVQQEQQEGQAEGEQQEQQEGQAEGEQQEQQAEEAEPKDKEKRQAASAPPEMEIPLVLSESYLRKEGIVIAANILSKLRYDLSLPSPVEPMIRTLDKLLLDGRLSQETARLLLFTNKEVLPALAEAKTSFVANAKSLAGVRLKSRNNSEETLISLSFDAVRINQTTASGKLVRNLTWEAFRREGLLESLCRYQLSRVPKKLNSFKPYLAMLLFVGQPKQVEEYLKQIPMEDENGRNWFILANIQTYLNPSLQKFVETVTMLQAGCKDANEFQVAWTAQRILDSEKEKVVLTEADLAAIEELFNKTSHVLPPHQAGLLARASKDHQRDEEYGEALALAMASFFRYGRAKFPEKKSLEEGIQECFDKLASPMDLRKGSPAQMVPFLNPYPPAHNLVLCRDAESNFEDENRQRFMVSLTPLARFAYGDWSKGGALFSDDSQSSLIAKAPKDAKEAVSAAYAFGTLLYEDRLLENTPNLKLLDPIRGKLQRPVPPDAHFMALLTSSALMLNGLKNPERLAALSQASLEKQLLNKPSYEGNNAMRRIVFYQLYTLVKEGSPSQEFAASLAEKSQEASFLTGYGFIGGFKRSLDRLISFYGKQAEFPLEHIIDKEADWAFLRAWVTSASTPAGLDGTGDEAFRQYVSTKAGNWPLQGGETIMAWLCSRCAFALNEHDLGTALALVDWAFEQTTPCLARHYPALLALRGSLKALGGKTGGLLTAAEIIQYANIAPKFERNAYRSVGDIKPQMPSAKFEKWVDSLPKGKECAFWCALMGSTLNASLNRERINMPEMRAKPYQVTLAKAFEKFSSSE